MAAYRYPVPRQYRRPRYPYKFRSRKDSGALPVVVITVAVLAAGAGAGVKAVTRHHAAPAASAPAPADGNAAASQVTAFARSKVGRVPYLYGGTTDAGMDCSGFAQAAYASAGVTLKRTSQDQWASERHVPASRVVAGDLVFFAGSDGTWTAPGHVGIVTDRKRHLMIDAYATGTYVREEGYGPAASPGTGLSNVVGFTDPDPQAPASPVTAGAAPGPGEAGFIAAVLADLGAPGTAANRRSLLGWFPREYPAWPPWAANNPMSSTLPMPGSSTYNTLADGLHVQNYPTAAEGAQATALTLEGGNWYPRILTALRSGEGLCGNRGIAGELLTWSGNGYSEVC